MPHTAPTALANVKRFGGTDQAAGVEVSETVPAGKSWLLLGVSVQLVQGITQTPWPSLIIDDGTNTLFQGFSGTAAMSISTTCQHTWAPGLSAVGSAASTASTGPLPDGFMLPSGWRIRTLTTGIGANSNYGAPSLFIVEYS